MIQKKYCTTRTHNSANEMHHHDTHIGKLSTVVKKIHDYIVLAFDAAAERYARRASCMRMNGPSWLQRRKNTLRSKQSGAAWKRLRKRVDRFSSASFWREENAQFSSRPSHGSTSVSWYS